MYQEQRQHRRSDSSWHEQLEVPERRDTDSGGGGDPVGAARHVHSQLADDGTWLVVEPFAGDAVEDNLNPVGRIFYAGSTMLCTPASLSQEVGLALGAQAGEQRLAEVLHEGGFSRVRRAAETPFNLVLEVRP